MPGNHPVADPRLDGPPGLFGKGLWLHQEGHAIAVLLCQWGIDITRPEGHDPHTMGAALTPQAFAVADHGGLARVVREVGFAADLAGHGGEADDRAALLRDAIEHTRGELEKIAGVPEAELTPAAKLSALAAIEEMNKAGCEFSGAVDGANLAKLKPSPLGNKADASLKKLEGKLNQIRRGKQW